MSSVLCHRMMRFFVQLGNFHPHFAAHEFGKQGIAEFFYFYGTNLNSIYQSFFFYTSNNVSKPINTFIVGEHKIDII